MTRRDLHHRFVASSSCDLVRGGASVVRRHRFENIDVEFDLREGHNRRREIVASIKDLPYLVQTPDTDLARGGNLPPRLPLNSERYGWFNFAALN
jgi:hypothetical protein